MESISWFKPFLMMLSHLASGMLTSTVSPALIPCSEKERRGWKLELFFEISK
jgi:hypothetical protein